MGNPWEKAASQALQTHGKALQQVLGQAAGTVSKDEQYERYQAFRQNPDALLQWSTQVNGPERGPAEAQRYMQEMRKRYG